MGARPEDRNARQMHDAFPGGATLSELEAYIAAIRAAGAPDDAHPTATLNAENEIVFMVCVTERHPEINEMIERNRR